MAHEILIVDDDVTLLGILDGVLTSAGYRCRTSMSASDALRRLDHPETISVVLSDIYMPEMTGLEFVDRLMAIEGARPSVVLLTAEPSMEMAVDALRLGVCDFLMKPIRSEQLLAAVGRATARGPCTAPSSPDLGELIRQSQELTARLQKFVGGRGGQSSTAKVALPAPARPLLQTIETFQRFRGRFIARNKLDDVAWDLLLELASAEHQRLKLSVSGLMVSCSHLSSTTLLRRINELVERGFITRTADPKDARRHYTTLTPQAHGLITQFLEQVSMHLSGNSIRDCEPEHCGQPRTRSQNEASPAARRPDASRVHGSRTSAYATDATIS